MIVVQVKFAKNWGGKTDRKILEYELLKKPKNIHFVV